MFKTHSLKALAISLSVLLTLSSCATSNVGSGMATGPSAAQLQSLEGFPNNPAFWQASNSAIWDNLQHISLSQLKSAATQTSDPTNNGWISLAIISKQFSTNTPQLVTEIMNWQAQHPSHPANSLIPDKNTLTSLQTQPTPKHIVLLLPLSGPLARSGQAVRNGFLSAYYQAPAEMKSHQNISFSDTNNTPVPALYQKAITEGADSVAGPLTKPNVQTLLQSGGFAVPTLALNYTDSWGSLPQNFYEFGLSPVDEAKQVAAHAKLAGHSRAIIIAPADEWGQRVVKSLSSEWKDAGGTIADTYYFTTGTNFEAGIASLLHVNPGDTKNNKPVDSIQRRQDFNAIFLLARPEAARQIVPIIRYYYADKIPIYSTSVVFAG